MAPNWLNYLKSAVVPDREREFLVLAGPFRGVRLIDSPRTSQQIRFGLWEQETYKYIRRAMRDCSWVIDVGAGNGEMCLAFAKLTEASPIIAIDSFPHRAKRTIENIEVNRLSSSAVIVLQELVGSNDGMLPLDDVTVPRDRHGFIKIDVDGGEVDVLNSGLSLIKEARPRLLVETHSGQLERDCLAFFAAIGFATTIIPNGAWRRILPEARTGHNRWLFASASDA